MEPRKSITRDDLVRSGACLEGVEEVREDLFPKLTVVDVKKALAALDEDQEDYLIKAANMSGNCNGYGNGYGYGYGNGYGNGYGYGHGYGDGYGDGDG